MSNLEVYKQRIGDILRGRTQLSAKTIPEARLMLRQMSQVQKELRQVKKEINLTMKSLRSQYADQKEDVARSTFGKGLLQGFFGRKSVSRMDAAQKNSIRQTQNKHLAPYEDLMRQIDGIILEYDGLKLKAESWITQAQAEQ